MGAKQLLQRRLYDRRVHGQPYQVGDHVWLHTTVLARGNTKKLHHPWKGPYHVLKRLTDSTYRIQSLSNPREHAVVHFNRLKPCTTATAEQPSTFDPISPPPGDDGITEDTPHACGTCPFVARLFILGLTSVVCHILSCFRGNAHDCA